MKKKLFLLLCSGLVLSGCVQKQNEPSDDAAVLSTSTDVRETTDDAAALSTSTDIGENTENNKKTLLQTYFDGDHFPSSDEIMEVNMQAEAENYRVTVCEVLLDKLSCYFLIKLETIDGSVLPSGNLSMAPETHSSILTDIYMDYMIYILDEDGRRSQGNTLYCDRIDNNEKPSVGYFILGGDYIDDYGALAVNPVAVELAIDNITLYAPYYEAAEEEEPLISETLNFEIPVTGCAAGKTKTFSDGREGYLTANGFCINTELDPREYPSVVWTITFDDGTVLSSRELDRAIGGGTLHEGGLLCLSWFGRYIDIDKVSTITINGEEYEWK